MSTAKWIEEDWRGQSRYSLKVLDWLHDERSPHQRIQVVDTQVYGRVLVLDGIFQTSERDEHYYHDVIILDGSDPVGPSQGLYGIEFYRHCERVLKADGVFALQSESIFETHELWHDIQRSLHEVFVKVDPYLGMVPLYGTGTWSWTLCSRALDPLDIIEARAAAIEPHTRYYHRGIHRAAFTLPNELRPRTSATLRHRGTP
jgi:spermidine synthase